MYTKIAKFNINDKINIMFLAKINLTYYLSNTLKII